MFMLSQRHINSLGQWTSIYVHVVTKAHQQPRVVNIYICSCCHKGTSIAQGSGHLHMFMLSQRHINSLGQWTSIYVHVLTKAHRQPRVVDIYICSCCHKGTSIAQGSEHLYMFMLSQRHINSLGQWTSIYIHVLTKAHQQPRVVDIYICSCPHKSTTIAQGSGHLYMFMSSQRHIDSSGEQTSIYVHVLTKAHQQPRVVDIYICSCCHKGTSIAQGSGHLYMFMSSQRHIDSLGQQTSIYVHAVTKAHQQPRVVNIYICSCCHKGTSIAQGSGHLYMFMSSQRHINSLGQWTSIYVHVVTKAHQQPRVVDIYICSCPHKGTSIAQGSGHLYMFMSSQKHINSLGQWTSIYVHVVTKAHQQPRVVDIYICSCRHKSTSIAQGSGHLYMFMSSQKHINSLGQWTSIYVHVVTKAHQQPRVVDIYICSCLSQKLLNSLGQWTSIYVHVVTKAHQQPRVVDIYICSCCHKGTSIAQGSEHLYMFMLSQRHINSLGQWTSIYVHVVTKAHQQPKVVNIYICSCCHKGTSIAQGSGHLYMFMLSQRHINSLGQWTSIYVHVLTKAHRQPRVVDIYICSCCHKGTSIAQGSEHLYMFMLSQRHINSLGQWTSIYIHVLTKAHQQPRVVDIYICSCPHKSTTIAQGSGHLYMFMSSQRHIDSLGQQTSIYVHVLTKAHKQPRVVDIYICSCCHKGTSIAQGSGHLYMFMMSQRHINSLGQWTSIYIHVVTKAHQQPRVVDIYICSCPHKSTTIAQGSGHLYMFMSSQRHINSLGQWTSIYVHVVTKAHQQPRVVDIYICSCPHKGTSIAQGSGHLHMFMLSQRHINNLGQWTSIYVHVLTKAHRQPRVVDIYICSCCHKGTSIAQDSGHLYMFMLSQRHINSLRQ